MCGTNRNQLSKGFENWIENWTLPTNAWQSDPNWVDFQLKQNYSHSLEEYNKSQTLDNITCIIYPAIKEREKITWRVTNKYQPWDDSEVRINEDSKVAISYAQCAEGKLTWNKYKDRKSKKRNRNETNSQMEILQPKTTTSEIKRHWTDSIPKVRLQS